jgi:hypothetical protein
MNWHFRPLTPGEPTRDPIIGEFFATEAIRNPAEAVVREDNRVPGEVLASDFQLNN